MTLGSHCASARRPLAFRAASAGSRWNVSSSEEGNIARHGIRRANASEFEVEPEIESPFNNLSPALPPKLRLGERENEKWIAS